MAKLITEYSIKTNVKPLIAELKRLEKLIENEYEIPGELKGFIKDYQQFTNVNEQTWCKERSLEDIARFIPGSDAILVMSTWMYKDQLEEYVKAFSSGMFGLKKFYIFYFLRNLHDWFTDKNNSYLFYEYEEFKTNIIKLITTNEVYDIIEDFDSPKITDNFWWGCSSLFSNANEQKPRYPYKAVRILWDENEKMFYHEGKSAQYTKEFYK